MDIAIEDGTLDFTEDWFTQHIPVWEQMLPTLPARDKFLEIGSFEGRATCWMLQHLSPTGEMFCIDTWEGSPEFHVLPKEVVEQAYTRFCRNVKATRGPNQKVPVYRNTSVHGLANLLAGHPKPSFDLIYVDGGHHAYQTLTDACMAWPLLKPGGVMIFDDYLWDLQMPPTHRPKLAIDVFVSLFFIQLTTELVGHQYGIRKI